MTPSRDTGEQLKAISTISQGPLDGNVPQAGRLAEELNHRVHGAIESNQALPAMAARQAAGRSPGGVGRPRIAEARRQLVFRLAQENAGRGRAAGSSAN